MPTVEAALRRAASGDIDGAMTDLRAIAEKLAASGHGDEAIQVYERMQEHRADPEASRAVADLLLDRGAAGDAVAALSHLQICFQSTQRDPATLRVLARAFDAVGQPSRAMETRKLLLRILQDELQPLIARAVVSRLLVDAPDDDNVRQAAIVLGVVPPAPTGPEDSYPVADELEADSLISLDYEEDAFGELKGSHELDEASMVPVLPPSLTMRATAPPTDRAVRFRPAIPPMEPTTPYRRGALLGSASLEPTAALRREDLLGPYPSFELTTPRRRGELLGAAPSDATTPFRRDASGAIEAIATGRDPTMPFRRDTLATSDSTAPPDPTMPFCRDALNALDEAATRPDSDDEWTGETVRPAASDSILAEQVVAEVLEEVAFYESQDLLDDALALVEEQMPSFRDNELLMASYRRLRDALGIKRG